jgi:hypothetical protein
MHWRNTKQKELKVSNLVPVESGLGQQFRSRSTSRSLSRIDSNSEIGLAIIESKAEIQAAKMMAISYVGKRAMHEVAMVSQLEQQLATIVPMATSRLQAIGDMVALSAAEVVAETLYRVSR